MPTDTEKNKNPTREIKDMKTSIFLQLGNADKLTQEKIGPIILSIPDNIMSNEKLVYSSIFDNQGNVNESKWKKIYSNGGGHGRASIYSQIEYPDNKVFVKTPFGRGLTSWAESQTKSDPESAIEFQVAYGDKTPNDIEVEILSRDISPNIIKPLEIKDGTLVLPYLDSSEYVEIENGTLVKFIDGAPEIISTPPNQVLKTAIDYLDMTIDLCNSGYSTEGRKIGDIDIRVNPISGKVIFFDYSLARPINIDHEPTDSEVQNYCISQNIDNTESAISSLKRDATRQLQSGVYSHLSSMISNILGIDDMDGVKHEKSVLPDDIAKELGDILIKFPKFTNGITLENVVFLKNIIEEKAKQYGLDISQSDTVGNTNDRYGEGLIRELRQNNDDKTIKDYLDLSLNWAKNLPNTENSTSFINILSSALTIVRDLQD